MLISQAHSLKEGVKEKGAGINLGNVQVIISISSLSSSSSYDDDDDDANWWKSYKKNHLLLS